MKKELLRKGTSMKKRNSAGSLMKKLSIVGIVMAVVLAFSMAGWADVARGDGAELSPQVSWKVANWIILYIPDADMSVDLGTIDDESYNPVTEEWTDLESTDHSVYVITNHTSGFTLVVKQLTVSDVTAPTGVDKDEVLSKFKAKGGDQSSYTVLTGGDTTVLDRSSNGIFSAKDISYKYTPDTSDLSGNYNISLTYTVTEK